MAKREKRKRNSGSVGHNRNIGEDFLSQNAKKDGVITTSSGLQYTIIDEKQGEKPELGDTVLIHQRALLLKGNILEDTYKQNKPVEEKVGDLLEGLQEGLQLMSVGSRYKFWLPPDLAWGKKGTGKRIPPFAVISFDVRLVEILDNCSDK